MAIEQQTPDAHTRQLDVLHQFLDARIGRHALFFEIDMDLLPDGSPEIIGHALDAGGQAYWFAMSWDAEAQAPTLRTFKPVLTEAHWWRTREYLNARRALGLPEQGNR